MPIGLVRVGGGRRRRGPTLDLWYSWELRDSGGRVVRRGRPRRSRSFVKGFLGYITQGSANVANAPSGASYYGVQVGTGTSPPQVTDTGLENLISNGSGSGQLNYGATNFESPVINTSTNQGTITIYRSFTNLSGGSITVSEVGITVAYVSGGNIYASAFIAHDLLPSPVTVPNNQSLTVTYQIIITT